MDFYFLFILFIFFILGVLNKTYDDYLDIKYFNKIYKNYEELLKCLNILFLILASIYDYNFIIISVFTFIICYFNGDTDDSFWFVYLYVMIFIGIILYKSFKYDKISMMFILYMLITIIIDISCFSEGYTLKKIIWRIFWILSLILSSILCIIYNVPNNTIFYYTFHAFGYMTPYIIHYCILRNKKANIKNKKKDNTKEGKKKYKKKDKTKEGKKKDKTKEGRKKEIK